MTRIRPYASAFLASLMAIFAMLFSMPASADNGNHGNGNNGNHYGHRCNDRCRGNGHHDHRCDHRCNPHVHCVTNVVTVQRFQTNIVTRTVTVNLTNTYDVTVTNIVDCGLGDAVAAYQLTKGHVYHFWLFNGVKWERWGRIVSSTDTDGLVRIIVPGYLVRPVAPVWQVVDVTKGFPRAAVPQVLLESEPARSFVAVNHMVLRVRR